MMKLTRKAEFVRDLRGRCSLRLHMCAILAATGCSGVLASKVLLALGLTSLAIRYPLPVLLAYVVFFLAHYFPEASRLAEILGQG